MPIRIRHPDKSSVRWLPPSPAVSDAERAAQGITVPDPAGTLVGPPTTHPVVMIECSARLQHTVAFTDSATPTRKAKPAGVLGAENWVSILPVGQPTPTDPALLPLPSRERAGVRAVALDTKTPYTLDFGGADGGKNANYLLRWVNPTGEKGPPALDGAPRAKAAVAQRRVLAPCQGWSETAPATIGV